MRELREFRVHHSEFTAAGIELAGMSRDTPDHNRDWTERLSLPYPVLSDADGVAGRRLGVLRSLHIGAWTIEFLRRSTLLVAVDGTIAAVWSDVRIRGHATQVLAAAKALTRPDRPSP